MLVKSNLAREIVSTNSLFPTLFAAKSLAVSELSSTFAETTELLASSLAHTLSGAKSIAARELFITSLVPTALAAISFTPTLFAVSCTLFQVPPISPESCTLPAVEVVAYGTLAEFPILTQADALQR